MLQLGEQLITDEVAAISELVKNSYDADATEVTITLNNVSTESDGFIRILDNGSGMSRDSMIVGWLELATINKARKPDEKARHSPIFGRSILGEKGLGRLAVHKLGLVTEIVSRAVDAENEAVLTIDWSRFEDPSKYLDGIPVEIAERKPEVFVSGTSTGDYTHGMQITITKIRRVWDERLLTELTRKVVVMSSPLAGFRDFKVIMRVNDPKYLETESVDYESIEKNATYVFRGRVSSTGVLSFKYEFRRPELPDLNRVVERERNLLEDLGSSSLRKPSCGPFNMLLYSWELTAGEKKAVFGTAGYYDEVVRPNAGIKVFRDGFRVLPYGDEDNDWLGLDKRRIARFELHISRNQIIGFVDITAEDNPLLIDKSDREGLISNDAFNDFESLVIGALRVFENLRLEDRNKLKERTGRSLDKRKEAFNENIRKLLRLLDDPAFRGVPYDKRKQLEDLVTDTRTSFENTLEETEEPLLAAAGIGLSAMVPTHDARISVQEAIKVLRKARDGFPDAPTNQAVGAAVQLLRQADEIIGNITRIQQRSAEEEKFPLSRPIDLAEALFKFRMERRKIRFSKDIRKQFKVSGSSRQLTILLVNMLDNSTYWLQGNPPEGRQIKIIVDAIDDRPALVVSDNGPGIRDPIEVVTLPFVTTKRDGMGLGLYICDRIAANHNAELRILSDRDLPGLLPGANIATLFPQQRERMTSDKGGSA